jgi:hypothetical protein
MIALSNVGFIVPDSKKRGNAYASALEPESQYPTSDSAKLLMHLAQSGMR